MSTCAEIRRRGPEFLDGELPGPEVAEVRAHLEACADCRERFERERRFREAVRRGGREAAPPELRERVRAILGSSGGPAAKADRAWRWWAPLAAAAILALVLVARPWRDPAPVVVTPAMAAAFAADHEAHAASAPEAAPFPPGAAPAPPLGRSGLRGVSRCVVSDRAWAHFTYEREGATFSVFLPLDDVRLPLAGEAVAGRGARVLALPGTGGRPGAILVSDELSADAMRGLWLHA